MASVQFFNEDVSFRLKSRLQLKSWIKATIQKEKYTLKTLNYIFCSDSALLERNRHYLNHNTFTDIITFDLSEEEGQVEGEIYISVDRVRENADKFSGSFEDELHRVLIHGVLHLVGYRDKGAHQKAEMRKKEDFYLKRLRQKP
jgi:probable rRNA maturation factor